MKDPYEVLEYPLSTEKAVRQMETDNCLIFIVKNNSTKPQIKWAIQKAFDAKVIGVRTMLTIDGQRKAFVKLSPETPASEITSALGLI